MADDAPVPPRQPLAPVQDIDHLVLTCASIPATLTWYTSHLGMQATSFASEADPSVTRHALRFGTHKINLHQRGREFEPKAATALPGTADLCFLIDPGVDLTAVARGFADVGVEVLEGGGVVGRTGARGRIRSVYVRDPDGNLIEYVAFFSSHLCASSFAISWYMRTAGVVFLANLRIDCRSTSNNDVDLVLIRRATATGRLSRSRHKGRLI